MQTALDLIIKKHAPKVKNKQDGAVKKVPYEGIPVIQLEKMQSNILTVIFAALGRRTLLTVF